MYWLSEHTLAQTLQLKGVTTHQQRTLPFHLNLHRPFSWRGLRQSLFKGFLPILALPLQLEGATTCGSIRCCVWLAKKSSLSPLSCLPVPFASCWSLGAFFLPVWKELHTSLWWPSACKVVKAPYSRIDRIRLALHNVGPFLLPEKHPKKTKRYLTGSPYCTCLVMICDYCLHFFVKKFCFRKFYLHAVLLSSISIKYINNYFRYIHKL